MTDKQIYQIGLTMINGVGDILARHLLQSLGDAEAVFKEKQALLEKIPGIGRKLAAEIKHPNVLIRAEKEMSFIEKNSLSFYFLTDTHYPTRLKECPDAPVLFYFKGNVDLNSQRIISVVGTRTPTEYGKKLTQTLLQDLSNYFPDLLIVSGLAYGIDICAHQQALKNQLPTVGVLAHGLDRIYPFAHRNIAIQMLEQGGLLTDFPSGTDPDRPNFLCRNRIIAGLSDCTIVIESAERGGSLVTADIAFSYGREVYCFPGRANDHYSKGCNNLIRKNKAGLITSAEDLLTALCWDIPTKPIQAEFSFKEQEDSDEQHPILQILKNQETMHINQLALILKISIQQLSALLFDLEMDGKIKSLPGNMYKRV